ncbi:putative Zn-dependent peptidase [Sulfurospirillum barnesii SES-3]|uniref:Putative Zn-dependent peptidase n=2 Tax=Sulfurospirillum barnesii TaxID=44674 RepID=I3XX27_SULBS|nr:putative Zn-dependent peptidase [Sulfurospirillum barnesii SES-3]
MKYLLLFLTFLGALMANSLPQHVTKTLDNGLQIVVIPMNNKSDVITTDIFYKVGSGNEIMGKSGIAHMLEHLNFKSTKNLKSGEFDEIVKGFGGVNNASTGFDYTHYFIKSSSKNLAKSLELFAELMQNLRLTDEEFQPERNVVLEERLWRTDNSPIGYLYFRLFNNAFTYHPYHWTPIGFKEDIKHWSIEDIRSFHSKYYQPANAIVVVAGDISPEVVFQNVETYFASIKNDTEVPLPHHQIEPQQDGAKRVMLKKESEVEMVAIAYKIPNFKHEDQVALSGLSELLSSGKSSKLQRVLVDEKQLVNQVYGYAMQAKDPSLFLFLAVCNPGVKAEDVEKEILAIVESLKKGEISDKEIEKIKINTKADFIHNLESSSELASLFGSYYAKGDIAPLLNYEEQINQLKKEDIINAVTRYLVPQSSTTVILRKDY